MKSELTITNKILLWIFKTFPPRDKDIIFKKPVGRADSEYEDEKRLPFYRYFRKGTEMFEGKEVLDLGSGYGGRTIRYLEYGAQSVTGLEINEELVSYSKDFAKLKSAEKTSFIIGVGEKIPCKNESFDLIVMNDVMEHVISPSEVLLECYRVLRPSGRLALSFPPYYSLSAGSHLHGYATSFPGLNLIFSTRALKSVVTLLLNEKKINYRNFLREVPTDKLWNQNGLTVKSFKNLIKISKFNVEEIQFIGYLDHRFSDHKGVAAIIRLPFYLIAELLAYIPFIQEIFCLRICALIYK
jgi:SAM-dependent methyltransferase